MKHNIGEVINAEINDEYATTVKGEIVGTDESDNHLIYVINIIESTGNIEIHQSKKYGKKGLVAVNEFEVKVSLNSYKSY